MTAPFPPPPRGHAFLPVSVDAVADLALPHLPKGSAIWAVGLTARGKLGFATFSVPGSPMLTGFVLPEMCNPFTLAAAICTTYRGIADTECEHTCRGLLNGPWNEDDDEDDQDEEPQADPPARRFHA